MPTWIGLVIALVAAIVAFIYLPTPINWIVGGLILLFVVAIALQGRGRTGRL
jgi:hypothetical protein